MEKNSLIWRVCRHEAGHLIAAKEMGFTTHKMEAAIYSKNGHRALSVIELWTPHMVNIPSTIEYITKRLIVLYAGVIAESLDKDGNYDGNHAENEWHNGGAMDDYSKIRELTQLLRNLRFPDTVDIEKIDGQLKEIGDDLCAKTGELMLCKKELLCDLSDAFVKKFKDYGIKFDLTKDEMLNIKTFREAYPSIGR